MLSINSINKRIERLQKKGLGNVVKERLKGIENLDLKKALTKKGRLKEKYNYTEDQLRALEQNIPTWKTIKVIASQTANKGEDLVKEYKNKLKIQKVLNKANDEYYLLITELANYAPKTYSTAQAQAWAESLLEKTKIDGMEIGRKLVYIMRDFGSDYHDMESSGMSYTEGVKRLNESIKIMKDKKLVDAFVEQFVNI